MIHAPLLFCWYSHTIFTPLNDHHLSSHCRLEAVLQTKERSSLHLPCCRGGQSRSWGPAPVPVTQKEGEPLPTAAPLMAAGELEPAPGHSAHGCCLQDRELGPIRVPSWLGTAWPDTQTGAGQLEVAVAMGTGHLRWGQPGHAGMLVHRWDRPIRSHGWAGQGCGVLETGPRQSREAGDVFLHWI